MASSVTEGHIQKLRGTGYLSSDIVHRLPEEGEIIPTPRPHGRVVFLSHFLCDWASLSTHLSGGSCSTMAWISMIRP